MRTFSRRKEAPAPVPSLSPPQKRKGGLSAFFSRRERPAPAPVATPAPDATQPAPRRSNSSDALSSDAEDDDGEPSQSYLDGRSTQCLLCHMHYARGVAEDEALHRKHCQRYRHGVKWTGGEGDVVLQSFPDGSRIVWTERRNANVCEALEVADAELGFADGDDDVPGEHLPSSVYLLVSETRHVVGLAVVMAIARGFRVCPPEASARVFNVMCSRDAGTVPVALEELLGAHVATSQNPLRWAYRAFGYTTHTAGTGSARGCWMPCWRAPVYPRNAWRLASPRRWGLRWPRDGLGARTFY